MKYFAILYQKNKIKNPCFVNKTHILLTKPMGFMSNNKTTKHNFVHFVLNNKIEQNAILTLSRPGVSRFYSFEKKLFFL